MRGSIKSVSQRWILMRHFVVYTDHDHDHHGHSDHGSEALNGTESAGNACSLVELQGEYDLALHIGAIFIIMAVSFLGTTLPMLFQRFFSVLVVFSHYLKCNAH